MYLRVLFVLIVSLNFAPSALAGNKEHASEYFKRTVTDINKTLQKRQEEFKKNPLKLVGYVDESLIPLWSSHKTMRGLLSSKTWKTLNENQRASLARVFKDTLQRYVQEGFDSYDGQTVEFVKLKLHPKKPRGLLTIKVIPNLLPSFHIDLKVENNAGKWSIYDVLVQGVSYISLKKEGVRELYSESGLSAVLDAYTFKNQGFIPSGSK